MKGEIQNSKGLRGFFKFSLSAQGLSINDFAKIHGMTRSSLVIAFYRPFPKAERIIADALNLHPWELWPSRYTGGRPNRPNLWYRRKSGGWKPKISGKGRLSQGKDLNEDSHEKN